MLQVIAQMLLGIEAFMFNLPPQSPGSHHLGNGVRIDRQIGQIDTGARLERLPRQFTHFMAFKPL